MINSGPHIYNLKVKKKQIENKFQNGVKVNFSQPVTGKCKKIYLVLKDKEICYVGITTQSISSRLRYGVKADGSKGYYGYKWLHENGDYNLVVWIMDDIADIETIEAEIVFLFRKKYNKWPKCQNEIHFHQSNDEERKIAAEILKKTMAKV